MKRIFTLILALLLVCACFVACDKGSDQETESSTTTEAAVDELAYKLNADGKGYTVTGIGTYTKTDLVIDTYKDLPVTEIDAYAFKGKNITSVTLGDSVTKVGNQAFSGCKSLKSITIGTGITDMGFFTFDGCAVLTDVYYNGTLESWCNITFGDAGNPVWRAKKLQIKNASGGYDPVTEIVIPETVTVIKDFAFEGFESVTKVVIPNTVTSIGESAFANCAGITSLTIPSSVTEIKVKAFKGCTNLKSVDFQNAENWKRGRGASIDLTIPSSELKKPAEAAKFLTTTFVEDAWQIKK